jgi:Flp pilus assembly pilin Flp
LVRLALLHADRCRNSATASTMNARLMSFTKDETEVTIVDHGLIAALIAVVIVIAVTMFVSSFNGVAAGL